MAPFRPSYVNKRYYPGNASVVGPTCSPTIGFNTTTCNVGICTLCGTQTVTFVLGCRCMANSYDCCQCCCCCFCTICTRTVPQGKWSKWEQYEARTRDAWGDSSCSSTAPVGYCSATGTLNGTPVDCRGFYICCGPSTNKWFVSPSCTQVGQTWYCRNDAVTCANSCMGACGWFVPSCAQLSNPGYSCRTYWDPVTASGPPSRYWSNCPNASYYENAIGVLFYNGSGFNSTKTAGHLVRAFRCTP